MCSINDRRRIERKWTAAIATAWLAFFAVAASANGTLFTHKLVTADNNEKSSTFTVFPYEEREFGKLYK